jgi:cytoplasmic FMR1 interacting protein
MMKEMEPTVSSQVKEDMYLVIVDGFQLLSEWTGRVWEQSAWKFSRPTTELSPFDTDRSKDVSDYEKVKNIYIYINKSSSSSFLMHSLGFNKVQ